MKRLFMICLGGTLVSCTATQQISSQRNPSSSRSPLRMVSPVTNETFWSEYQAAKPGFDPEDGTSSEYRNGVFFRWMKANPVALYRDLREKSPVLFLDQNKQRLRRGMLGEKFVVVATSADVQHVLKSRSEFSLVRDYDSILIGTGQKYAGQTENKWISAFATRDREKIQQMIQPLIEKSIEEGSYVGKDENGRLFTRIEYVSQLGRKVPFLINEKIFGLSGFEMKEATELSRSLADDLLLNPENNPVITERAKKAYEILDAYLVNLLDGRIQPPAGTTLAELQAQFRQQVGSSPRLVPAERRNLVKILAGLFAGVETSQTSVARALEQLMLHGQLDRAQRLALQNDDEGLRRMMYEALRFEPVAPYAIRKVTVQTRLPSGAVLQPGMIVLAGTQSAMFDENVVSDPYSFKPDRPFKEFKHFRRSGMAQIRDQVTEIESFEILKALLKKSGLRRAEGHFGEIDERRPITANLIKKDKNRMSFPERWDLVFDAAALRPGIEVSDKEYPYEDYLMNYDRDSFRLCLGGIKQSLAKEDDEATSGRDLFWKNMGEIGRILKQTRTIVGNISITKMNRTRENKHLLYCRMPAAYRSCVETQKFSILKPEQNEVHRAQYAACRNQLTDLEQNFYENVFFNLPLDTSRLNASQAKRPQDPFFYFEDQLKFYDRYRARESMMNPAGYVMNDRQMLFYVRLNIDFRMCLGGPVLANKYTMGLKGAPKAEQYEKCKDGVINPENFRREGALTALEKYLYEKIML